MKGVFEKSFAGHLGKGSRVEIQGRIYPSELLLSVGFSRPNQLKQPNFEISASYDSSKDNVLKVFHLLFDAAGALFDQYFQATEDNDFPRYWEEIDFEKRKIFVQYSTKNTDLESQADELLGKNSDALMQEPDEDSETFLEDIKNKLGLTDED